MVSDRFVGVVVVVDVGSRHGWRVGWGGGGVVVAVGAVVSAVQGGGGRIDPGIDAVPDKPGAVLEHGHRACVIKGDTETTINLFRPTMANVNTLNIALFCPRLFTSLGIRLRHVRRRQSLGGTCFNGVGGGGGGVAAICCFRLCSAFPCVSPSDGLPRWCMLYAC